MLLAGPSAAEVGRPRKSQRGRLSFRPREVAGREWLRVRIAEPDQNAQILLVERGHLQRGWALTNPGIMVAWRFLLLLAWLPLS